MQQQVVALFERKLIDLLRAEDSKALAGASSLWSSIGPASTCPDIGTMMRSLQHTLAKGHVAREVAVKELICETASAYESLLSPAFSNELMSVVERHFPQDKYVQVGEKAPDVYKRRMASPNKYSERTYELEMALIRASASNGSSQAIARVRTLLDEALLRKTVSAAQATPIKEERVVSQINFNGAITGAVTVAGESIQTTVLNLSLGDILARIESSPGTLAQKEEARSRLGAFLNHPLVTSIVGGIAGGITGAAGG